MKGTACAIALMSVVIVGSSYVAAQRATGDPKNGQVIYERHCLRCHGLKLDGKGPDTPFLVVNPANLLSLRSRGKTDWELLLAITQGVAFSPMHGWNDRLSQDQIMDVLAYIRMMAPFDAVG